MKQSLEYVKAEHTRERNTSMGNAESKASGLTVLVRKEASGKCSRVIITDSTGALIADIDSILKVDIPFADLRDFDKVSEYTRCIVGTRFEILVSNTKLEFLADLIGEDIAVNDDSGFLKQPNIDMFKDATCEPKTQMEVRYIQIPLHTQANLMRIDIVYDLFEAKGLVGTKVGHRVYTVFAKMLGFTQESTNGGAIVTRLLFETAVSKDGRVSCIADYTARNRGEGFKHMSADLIDISKSEEPIVHRFYNMFLLLYECGVRNKGDPDSLLKITEGMLSIHKRFWDKNHLSDDAKTTRRLERKTSELETKMTTVFEGLSRITTDGK